MRSFAVVLLLGLSGCNVLGALAAKAPRPDVDAAYKGLAGQTVGVMVWADRGTQIDFSRLQLDVAE
ncbi:MAG TPA: hypothetical protein VF595_04295, partial [Tepidisphaeraceae bacterium]